MSAIDGLFAAQVAADAEMIGDVERSDLDTDRAIETLTVLPITSPGDERDLDIAGIANRYRTAADARPVRSCG